MEVRGIGRLQSLIVSLTSIWRAIMFLLPDHQHSFYHQIISAYHFLKTYSKKVACSANSNCAMAFVS